jgi:3-oxoacyl-[acyl-carrier-protein] synthase III
MASEWPADTATAATIAVVAGEQGSKACSSRARKTHHIVVPFDDKFVLSSSLTKNQSLTNVKFDHGLIILSTHCLQDTDASKDASYGNIHMAGQDVFKFAVRSVPAVIDAALKQAQLTKDDVDWLVMHQANQRILDAAAQRLGLPAERVSCALLGRKSA